MITLNDKTRNRAIGTITEDELTILQNGLEEEHASDQDYWINRDMVTNFKESLGDIALVATLEAALGDLDEIDVEWVRA